MTVQYDGAVIFDCTTVNKPNRYRAEIIRPLAPFAIHEVIQSYHIPSTVINYTDFWDHNVLFDTLVSWLDSQQSRKPLLLVSTLFSQGVFNPDNTVTKVLQQLKSEYDCTIILGGPMSVLDYQLTSVKPDAVFQGRSLNLFSKWLNGDYSKLPIRHVNGIDVFHDQSGVVQEDPIVTKLYADYCLDHNDILQFETRLGCKFNCTFCAYEYRNAKKVIDSTAEKLYDFFDTAKQQYGITNYSCVDDTFNEDPSKIDTLHAAVSALDYMPTTVGYNRFDLMMHHHEQAQQLDECGFHGHYFGIETLHREASKLIRKGIRKQRAYDFMRHLRDEYPHWWTCSGYIVGIPLEPAEHVHSVMRDIRDQKLLKSVLPVGLGLYNIPGNEHNFSEFSKNPENYGITVLETGPNANWRHDLMTRDGATMLAQRIAAKNTKQGIPVLDPWEWISRNIVPDNTSADLQIQRYINRKISYLTK